MRKVFICAILLTSFLKVYAQSNDMKHQALTDSVKLFFKTFSNDIQQLSYQSESSKWTQIQNGILQNYFLNDEIAFPNIIEDDEVYRIKRSRIPVNKFLEMLPFACWQGFQFVIDSELIKILSIKKSFGKLKEIECLIPVKFWGIKVGTRKLHRIGEYFNVTLIPSMNKNSNSKEFQIKQIVFTQRWIFDEPLTAAIIDNIEKELVEELNTLLKSPKRDKKRRLVCQKLKNILDKDTIFYYETDKVIKSLSINECEVSKPTKGFWNMKSGFMVDSFDLSYITDIHLSSNGQYIGLRSRLEKVSTHSLDKSQWLTNRKNDYVVVPNNVAQSQLSYWQLSNVFIQTLIKQK